MPSIGASGALGAALQLPALGARLPAPRLAHPAHWVGLPFSCVSVGPPALFSGQGGSFDWRLRRAGNNRAYCRLKLSAPRGSNSDPGDEVMEIEGPLYD
eukprot:11164215-Alexandrium_andersonii.AAC.1